MQLDLRSVVVGYGVAQMSAELADPRAGIRGRSEVRFRRQTGRHLLVLFRVFNPRVIRRLHSTCLPALVTDRAMEAWYSPFIA
jgi:hypothetical protein